jgi:hypothetical protein
MLFKATSTRVKIVKRLLSEASLLKVVNRKGYRVCDGVEIFPGGVAFLADAGVMVVADLHLGVEASLEYEGLSIPRVQAKKMGEYMMRMIERLSPTKVVVAGDLKHNFSRNLVQEWRDVERFVKDLSGKTKLEVIKGNHDNYVGSILGEYGVPLRREINIGAVKIVHGHAHSERTGLTVMGHIHPSIRLRDSIGASVKDHCYLWDPERQILVLPALSLVAAGIDVVSHMEADEISPILEPEGLAGCFPIVFSKDKALKFPSVGGLRRLL